MVEILKQNQYVPMDVEKQIAILFAPPQGHLDDLSIEKISDFETGLFVNIFTMPMHQIVLLQ